MAENDNQKPDYDYTRYPSKDFSEFAAPDITAWKLARSAIEHENGLVNHRLTWFFSSQAFLLTSFFVLISASDKPFMKELNDHQLIPLLHIGIVLLAVYLCLVTQKGLDLAFKAINNVTLHFNDLSRREKFGRTPPLHLWVPPDFVNQRFIPLAAILMWVVIEVTCGLGPYPFFYSLLEKLSGTRGMVSLGLAGLMIVAIVINYITNKRLRPRNAESLEQTRP